MTLTSAQQATLKAHIEATPELNAFPNNEDGAVGIANLLNLQADPDFTVWKEMVSITDVGNAFTSQGLNSLTATESGVLNMYAAHSRDGVSPSNIEIRTFYDSQFVGANGAATRANLLALWKRLANEIEKLYATGTGSDADPATLDFIGDISSFDVNEARNS